MDAFQSWDRTQRAVDYRTRAQHLLEVSPDWVAKWPDCEFAWQRRREALLGIRSASAELWKQIDENILRLSRPHSFAAVAAYDWVTAGVNVEAAEKLLQDEIAWEDSRPKPPLKPNSTLSDLVDAAWFTMNPFGMLCSLARAQIRLKQYDLVASSVRSVTHDPMDTAPFFFSFESDLPGTALRLSSGMGPESRPSGFAKRRL